MDANPTAVSGSRRFAGGVRGAVTTLVAGLPLTSTSEVVVRSACGPAHAH